MLSFTAGHPFFQEKTGTKTEMCFTPLGYMAWLMKRGDNVDRAYEAAFISFTLPPKRKRDHHKLATQKLSEIMAAGGWEQLPYWPNFEIECNGKIYG